jgi:NAD(P)-dependent dehydrogenase (short-subunit alcohol dehydrogenase family)
MDRKGATALGTGGNGGLRRRICRALAKEGVHIAVMYAQNRDRAESVARELTSRHLVVFHRRRNLFPIQACKGRARCPTTSHSLSKR